MHVGHQLQEGLSHSNCREIHFVQGALSRPLSPPGVHGRTGSLELPLRDSHSSMSEEFHRFRPRKKAQFAVGGADNGAGSAVFSPELSKTKVWTSDSLPCGGISLPLSKKLTPAAFPTLTTNSRLARTEV
jgi:hypothetical protein